MSVDRFSKVYDALRGEFPDGGDVSLAVGIGELSGDGDSLIAFQENADPFVTDNVRQVRTIGVRLVALSIQAPASKAILKRATDALENDPNIRVFDMTGPSVDLEADAPAPEGMFVTSQRVDLR